MEEEKETDLESLARIVANGFSTMEQSMNERFDAVDARFDAMDTRFDSVENRMENVEHRLDTVVDMLDDHSRRIKDLELAS